MEICLFLCGFCFLAIGKELPIHYVFRQPDIKMIMWLELILSPLNFVCSTGAALEYYGIMLVGITLYVSILRRYEIILVDQPGWLISMDIAPIWLQTCCVTSSTFGIHSFLT